MNLYDKDDGFKQFTLLEANRLLPKINETTKYAVEELEKITQAFETSKILDEDSAQHQFEIETADILQQWTEDMIRLGVYPKGYFTVDFKTSIPDTLFCWTFGEKEVTHTHKVYENFKRRVPIRDKKLSGFEDSLN
ncbi:MAG: DUF2203 family protein [bacterium]